MRRPTCAGTRDPGARCRRGSGDRPRRSDRLAGLELAPGAAQRIHRAGRAYCSPVKPVHEPSAADRAARLHPPQRPQHLAPRHREVLARQQVAEHDAPAREQLFGHRLGELVGLDRVGGREQRPAALRRPAAARRRRSRARPGRGASAASPVRTSWRSAWNPSAVTNRGAPAPTAPPRPPRRASPRSRASSAWNSAPCARSASSTSRADPVRARPACVAAAQPAAATEGRRGSRQRDRGRARRAHAARRALRRPRDRAATAAPTRRRRPGTDRRASSAR